jgi:hypothetical protein
LHAPPSRRPSHRSPNKASGIAPGQIPMSLRIAFRLFVGTQLLRSRVPLFAGRANFYNFLTRASGLSKPSPPSLPFVGMQPASRPLAAFTPRCGRRSSRPPVSYADTHSIDACFAWLCFPDLCVLPLAARRTESQAPGETHPATPAVPGTTTPLRHPLSASAKYVESCLKRSIPNLSGSASAWLQPCRNRYSADLCRVVVAAAF